MSAFLILLGGPAALAGDTARAFDLARQRLSSRCVGDPTTGALGAARWAAIGTGDELAVTGEQLTVVDASPFMVEPAAPAGPSPSLLPRWTGITVELGSGKATLRRDAFGAKPLFYAPCDAGWLVASEAKALTPFLGTCAPDRAALSDAVNYRWVLGEDFLLSPIRQVPPGAEVQLAPGAPARVSSPRLLGFEPDAAASAPIAVYRERTEEALRSALRRAAAEVGELAVLISGGIDSSALAALARAEGLPARGYIVRYEGFANPELERSREVARRLDLPVEEVVVSREQLAERLPDIVWRLEQPPRHANNVALEALFRAIRRRSSVVVHGEGAEMMFGLADHYRVGQFARKRWLVAALLGWREWPALRRRLGQWKGDAGARALRLMDSTATEFARRLDEVLYSPAARTGLAALCQGRSPCPELNRLLPDGRAPTHEELQVYQAYTFLQCSLVRLDRLASPQGLSVALPFLSSEVVAVARRLPTRYKARRGQGKPILRDICDRYLPREVSRWPKMGFLTPDRGWVLGPVSQWRERLGATDAWELATLLPDGSLSALLALEDHETRWLLLTLEMALRQMADREAVEPGARAR